VKLCDVVLTSGKRRIPAHKLVLSAASDYLAVLLSSCDVSGAALPTVINLPDIDMSALDDVINYIYTGEFDYALLLQVSQENDVFTSHCASTTKLMSFKYVYRFYPFTSTVAVYGYSYKAFRARPGLDVICNF